MASDKPIFISAASASTGASDEDRQVAMLLAACRSLGIPIEEPEARTLVSTQRAKKSMPSVSSARGWNRT